MGLRRLISIPFVAVLMVATACSSPATGAPQPASTSSSKPQTSTVTMSDANQFQPATLTVPVGTTVTWTNTGSVQHTVTDDPNKAINKADGVLPTGAQAWDSGPLDGGQTYSHTFTTPGTYKYFCIPHEALGMVGTITVR